MLKPPRLLLYNDGRHANTYGYEPPMGIRQFREPVDELVDSAADTLIYCVGDTRVLLYDSKVGEHWGHNLTDWNMTVWHRAHVNLQLAIKEGIDPLRVVCERANEKGIRILPHLILPSQAWENRAVAFHGRASDFCFDHPEYAIGLEGVELPDTETLSDKYPFDYNLPEVRAERFRIIEELLTNYPTDGIELDWFTFKPVCSPGSVDGFRNVLTGWMGEIRETAERAAREQGREKTIAVRVPAIWEGCWDQGFNLKQWFEDGIIDWIIPNSAGGGEQLDQDMALEPFVEEAHSNGCKVFASFSANIGNDWYYGATKEMYHAAAANAYSQGVDGVRLDNFWPVSYPWGAEDYDIMRGMGHPDLLERKDKRFRARSQRGEGSPEDPGAFGCRRPLPLTLTKGKPGPEIPIRVADNLHTAEKDGCIDSVVLSTRVTDIGPEDELEFFLNDEQLPLEWARKDDYTYKIGYVRMHARIGAHYWFDFNLPESHWPLVGHNYLRVNLNKRTQALEKMVPVTVHDAEITIRYRPHRNAPKQFERFPDSR